MQEEGEDGPTPMEVEAGPDEHGIDWASLVSAHTSPPSSVTVMQIKARLKALAVPLEGATKKAALWDLLRAHSGAAPVKVEAVKQEPEAVLPATAPAPAAVLAGRNGGADAHVLVAAAPAAPTSPAAWAFLSCVPDTDRLARAKATVTRDRFNVAAWELIVDWAAKDAQASVPAKRALYLGMLDVFPTSGRLWRDLCAMELARGKAALLEDFFGRSLLQCKHVPLWMVYLDWIHAKTHATHAAARAETLLAYAFTVDHIGMDPESAPVWERYIKYLEDAKYATAAEEAERLSATRKVFQQAVTTPVEGIERLWQWYQRWEEAKDPQLAKALMAQFASPYTNARVTCRERQVYMRGLQRTLLAVPPTDERLQQVLLWKRLLLYEKCQRAPDLARVRFTFDACVAVLRHHPEVWIDFAETVHAMILVGAAAGGPNAAKELADAEAIKVFKSALEALPGSVLVHMRYASFLEGVGLASEAGKVFEMMLAREAISPSDKHLVLIQQLLFVRRSGGLEHARKYLVSALTSPHSSWQLYVTAARIELFMNRDAKAASKVFNHGLLTHGHCVPYLVAYIQTLYSMGEETNMRVLFDRLLADAVLRGNRELWDEFLRFEVAHGNFASIERVVQRRAEALGNAVDPNGIYGTLQRFKVLDLFPVRAAEIRSMSVGANVMLSDGRRGVHETRERQHAHQTSESQLLLEKGNPLAVLFRDPPALASVPRPIMSGDGCGLTPYTREMSVGAAMPGQDATGSVPEPLLELIAHLPSAHLYDGPLVPVDDLVALLRATQLPLPPAPAPLVAEVPSAGIVDSHGTKRPRASSDGASATAVAAAAPAPGTIANAPPSADIYRMRQQLLQQQRNAFFK